MLLRQPDFEEDILNYLRERRGTLVMPLSMVWQLTKQVQGREECRVVRGQVLSELSRLIREKKVIRYRKVTMVPKKPRSSQGLIRISERYC